MTLLAFGINHQTAAIDLREKTAITPDRAKLVLQEVLKLRAVNEAMILSTCNRTEFYGKTQQPELLQNWLNEHLSVSLDPWYLHCDENAVTHIMRVASGLDSMILGEPQILGQMKEAFTLAEQEGAIGSYFQKLFQRVFNVSKQVRTDTAIGANPITLGYCAVVLAKNIFSDLSKRSVLLIGAGEVVELAALHFYNQGVKRFILANRSSANAEKLAKRIYGHVISMADIPVYLKESDIVITATSSELPILGKGAVETAIKARKHRPIFMVDFALPRDIEPEVGSLEDIYLYNIDDFKSIIDENRQCRQAAAEQAEAIIALQARHFIKDLQSLDANNLIRQFRENYETISQQELQRAQTRIAQGEDPTKVLNQFANNLINKFCHTPSIQMKQAAFDGRLEILAFARQLLDL